jgi:Tol biopolymer transport system component
MGMTTKGSLYYSLNTGSEDVYIAKLDFTRGVLLSQPEKLVRRFMCANFSPTFSPDGNFLAYVSEIGPRSVGRGRRVLCIRSLKTGEEREMSPKLDAINRLSWSPDGRSILAVGLSSKNQQGTYRVDVESNEVTLVKEAQAYEAIRARVWSQDGKAIFCILTESKKKLWRLMMREIATGKENEIYCQETLPDFSRLSLSPDGTRLAFSTKGPKTDSSYLRIIPAQGGESRVLLTAEPQATIVPISWTSNGKEIFFAKLSGSRQAQTRELYSIGAEGGELRKLPFPFATDSINDLCVHPDGQRVAFTAGKQKTEIWVMENFLPKAEREKE